MPLADTFDCFVIYPRVYRDVLRALVKAEMTTESWAASAQVAVSAASLLLCRVSFVCIRAMRIAYSCNDDLDRATAYGSRVSLTLPHTGFRCCFCPSLARSYNLELHCEYLRVAVPLPDPRLFSRTCGANRNRCKSIRRAVSRVKRFIDCDSVLSRFVTTRAVEALSPHRQPSPNLALGRTLDRELASTSVSLATIPLVASRDCNIFLAVWSHSFASRMPRHSPNGSQCSLSVCR